MTRSSEVSILSRASLPLFLLMVARRAMQYVP